VFECEYPECKYRSTKRKACLAHVKRIHQRASPATRWPCEQCSNVYHSKTGLSNHVNSTHNTSPLTTSHVCEHPSCTASFRYASDLERHRATHIDVKSFVCAQCEFKCKRKSELTRHVRHVHEQSVPVLKCGRCKYETKSASHLKRHALLVHDRHAAAAEVMPVPNLNEQKEDEVEEIVIEEVETGISINVDADNVIVAIADFSQQIVM